MSEAEYDRLLEAVRMAIEPAPQEQFLASLPLLANLPMFDEPAEAANDNQQRNAASSNLAAHSVSRRLVRQLLTGTPDACSGLTDHPRKPLIASLPAARYQPCPSPSPYSR